MKKRNIPLSSKYSILCLFPALFLASCFSLEKHSLQRKKQPQISENQPIFKNRRKNKHLIRLAQEQHPKILAAYGGEYTDIQLERMIAKIVGNLTTVAENPGENYRITILDSASVNAFALPGGYLYITRGLLALANDSAEIAAVLAHEMGHVTARHGLTRQKLEEEEKVTAKIATDLLSKNPLAKTTEIEGKLRLARFSRNQELEADVIGIKSMAQAGYDTYAAERFLISMAAYGKCEKACGTDDSALDFLSSHPSTPHRIELAHEHARILSGSQPGVRERNAFLQGINGLIFGNSPQKGFMHGNMFVHPRFGITFALPERFTLERTGDVVHVKGPENVTIQFDCIKLDQNVRLTENLSTQWAHELDEESIQEIEINGAEAVTAKAYNEKWQFDMILTRKRDTTCRLLTVAPLNARGKVDVIHSTLVRAFRFLKPGEIKVPKASRVRILTVKAGDTVSRLAEKMMQVEQKQELFCILNALSPEQKLIPGEKVKIITNK